MKAESMKFCDARMRLGTTKEGLVGLVVLGCGGDLKDWIEGVSKYLYDEKASTTPDPDKIWDAIYRIETTKSKPKGRIDLIFVFKNKGSPLDIGRLAIVRIKMHDDITHASWWSDYIVNFKKEHPKC
jgi:hypothetical protein